MDSTAAFIRKRRCKFFVYVEYVDEFTGKKRQKSYGSYEKKKDAEKRLIEIKSTINNNKFIAPKELTVVDRCYKYIEDLKLNLSPVTAQTYESITKNQIQVFFKNIKLSELTPLLLQSFINQTYIEYEKGSANTYTTFLRSVIKEAYRLREINENINDFIKIPNVRGKEKNINIYDKQETKELLDKLLGNKIEIPIILMVALGLRFSEVAGLRWKDIDIDNNIININQILLYIKGNFQFKEPKTCGSKRSLTVSKEVIDKLKQEKLRQNKLKLQGLLDNEYDLVCLNGQLRPWTETNLRSNFITFTKKNNLRQIKLHDLRHTHATLLLLARTDYKTISERLGHSDINITLNTYSHVLDEMNEEASNNISKLLFS